MARPALIEFTQYIAQDGFVYNFDTDDKFLMSETGLGLPPIDYITQRGPFQHGETLIDYRLRPRVIQMVHRRNSCSRQDYWDARSDLLDHIRPNRSLSGSIEPGTLRKVLPNGAMRDIKVLIEQGPEFAARSLDKWDEFGIYETLRFIAHDPIFYSPVAVTSAFTLAPLNELVFYNAVTGVSALSINFARGPARYADMGRGLVFENGVIDNIITTTHDGSWISYPTITITGPLNGATIVNQSTGESIKMNYDIGTGEVVTIVTEYGAKSVTNNAGVNLIGTLSPTSSLATFHIAPDPEVVNGQNQIRVIGSAASPGVTGVSISFYPAYIGI